MPFPLPFIPKQSYKSGGRCFGAPRPRGRKHAGCDLIAPLDTPIFAMESGVVMLGNEREFFHGTASVVIQHLGFCARYCEVIWDKKSPLKRGKEVKAGEVIAHVGKMYVDSMLHLEIYRGVYGTGRLTVRTNPPFQRRADLLDPTSFLDKYRGQVQSAPTEV